MIVAILADLHANGLALERILQVCEDLSIDEFWFLGDLVGRGPNPVECLTWLMETVHTVNPQAWVLGNHDAMLVDMLTDEQWSRVNEEPRVVIPLHRQAIQDYPAGWGFVKREFNETRLKPRCLPLDGLDHWITHNALVDAGGFYRYDYPWYDESLLPSEFEQLVQQPGYDERPAIIWYGHSHVPSLISARRQGERFSIQAIPVFPGETYPLSGEQFWMINPGSAGQPRDLDQRASFVLLDTAAQTATFRRVAYDWRETARQIQALHYPDKLARILRDATPDKEIPQRWLDHFRTAREVVDD